MNITRMTGKRPERRLYQVLHGLNLILTSYPLYKVFEYDLPLPIFSDLYKYRINTAIRSDCIVATYSIVSELKLRGFYKLYRSYKPDVFKPTSRAFRALKHNRIVLLLHATPSKELDDIPSQWYHSKSEYDIMYCVRIDNSMFCTEELDVYNVDMSKIYINS